MVCCKNCENLMYYDWYYCGIDDRDKKDLYITDIEIKSCELFSKREGLFWLEGDF